MYRFRTAKGLLGDHKELENQEIYFASPDELNDPMEGYRDIFWKGDAIVWKNFISNYVRSAEQFFLALLIAADKIIVNEDHIVVIQTFNVHKTPDQRDLINLTINDVFTNDFLQSLPSELAQRDTAIRHNELLSYLEIIHPFVINSIAKIYHKKGLTPLRLFNQKLDEFHGVIKKAAGIAANTNRLEEETKSSAEKFFTVMEMAGQQMRLLSKYNSSGHTGSPNSLFFLADFPEKYLSKLESSIFPSWYSASFLSDCTNSAIWGHYGSNHKGVCMKFKTFEKDSKLQINLAKEPGYASGPVKGMRPHEFMPIEYHNKHVEIDFFRSIGRMTKGELNHFWYSDGMGNFSPSGDHLNRNEDEWRNNYWHNFRVSTSVKLSEWSYEKEYRLILHGDFINYHERPSRKIKYDFNDLDGIIFGMKTEIEDKIKIMKIIESKCKENNRQSFDFFQAYYSKDTGKIEHYKLDLVKFQLN